jgi:urocanate hydratase
VQDIMGDIFSLGFGPFRWICTSGNPKDLAETDTIAAQVMSELHQACMDRTRAAADEGEEEDRYSNLALQHFEDNHKWIVDAPSHNLVVGSQARILYVSISPTHDAKVPYCCFGGLLLLPKPLHSVAIVAVAVDACGDCCCRS